MDSFFLIEYALLIVAFGLFQMWAFKKKQVSIPKIKVA